MRKFIMTALLVLVSIHGVVSAAEKDVFEITAEGSYSMEAGASVDLAKQVALFTAKRKAVDLAGRYLARKHLIETYERNRDEIYSLTAREIRAVILAEKRETVGDATIYRLQIRARIEPSDFVKAKIADARQEEREGQESYQEEMDQRISAEIDPGAEIAKAYRLLREKKWRIMLIYLNHLEKKYPNWDRIHMAQGVGHYILHEPVLMEKALKKACRLGNMMACDDLKNIKKVNAQDFGISAID